MAWHRCLVLKPDTGQLTAARNIIKWRYSQKQGRRKILQITARIQRWTKIIKVSQLGFQVDECRFSSLLPLYKVSNRRLGGIGQVVAFVRSLSPGLSLSLSQSQSLSFSQSLSLFIRFLAPGLCRSGIQCRKSSSDRAQKATPTPWSLLVEMGGFLKKI